MAQALPTWADSDDDDEKALSRRGRAGGATFDERVQSVRSRIQQMMAGDGSSSDEWDCVPRGNGSSFGRRRSVPAAPDSPTSLAVCRASSMPRIYAMDTGDASENDIDADGDVTVDSPKPTAVASPSSPSGPSGGASVVLASGAKQPSHKLIGRDVEAQIGMSVRVSDQRMAKFVDPTGTIIEIRCGGERVRVQHNGTERAQRYYNTGKNSEYQLIFDETDTGRIRALRATKMNQGQRIDNSRAANKAPQVFENSSVAEVQASAAAADTKSVGPSADVEQLKHSRPKYSEVRRSRAATSSPSPRTEAPAPSECTVDSKPSVADVSAEARAAAAQLFSVSDASAKELSSTPRRRYTEMRKARVSTTINANEAISRVNASASEPSVSEQPSKSSTVGKGRSKYSEARKTRASAPALIPFEDSKPDGINSEKNSIENASNAPSTSAPSVEPAQAAPLSLPSAPITSATISPSVARPSYMDRRRSRTPTSASRIGGKCANEMANNTLETINTESAQASTARSGEEQTRHSFVAQRAARRSQQAETALTQAEDVESIKSGTPHELESDMKTQARPSFAAQRAARHNQQPEEVPRQIDEVESAKREALVEPREIDNTQTRSSFIGQRTDWRNQQLEEAPQQLEKIESLEAGVVHEFANPAETQRRRSYVAQRTAQRSQQPEEVTQQLENVEFIKSESIPQYEHEQKPRAQRSDAHSATRRSPQSEEITSQRGSKMIHAPAIDSASVVGQPAGFKLGEINNAPMDVEGTNCGVGHNGLRLDLLELGQEAFAKRMQDLEDRLAKDLAALRDHVRRQVEITEQRVTACLEDRLTTHFHALKEDCLKRAEVTEQHVMGRVLEEVEKRVHVMVTSTIGQLMKSAQAMDMPAKPTGKLSIDTAEHESSSITQSLQTPMDEEPEQEYDSGDTPSCRSSEVRSGDRSSSSHAPSDTTPAELADSKHRLETIGTCARRVSASLSGGMANSNGAAGVATSSCLQNRNSMAEDIALNFDVAAGDSGPPTLSTEVVEELCGHAEMERLADLRRFASSVLGASNDGDGCASFAPLPFQPPPAAAPALPSFGGGRSGGGTGGNNGRWRETIANDTAAPQHEAYRRQVSAPMLGTGSTRRTPFAQQPAPSIPQDQPWPARRRSAESGGGRLVF